MKHLPYLQTAFVTSNSIGALTQEKIHRSRSHFAATISHDVIVGLRAGGISDTSNENKHDDLDAAGNGACDDIIVTFRNELKRMREELEREAEMEIEATKRMIQRKEQRDQDQQQRLQIAKENATKTKQKRYSERKRLNNEDDDGTKTKKEGRMQSNDEGGDFINTLLDETEDDLHHEETAIKHDLEDYSDQLGSDDGDVDRKSSVKKGSIDQVFHEMEDDDTFIVGDTDENHEDVIEKLMMDEQSDIMPSPPTKEESAQRLSEAIHEDNVRRSTGRSQEIKVRQHQQSSMKRKKRKKAGRKKKKSRKPITRQKHAKQSKYQNLNKDEADEWYNKLIADDYNKSKDGDSLSTIALIVRSLVPTFVLAVLLFLSHVVFDALLKRI